MQEEVPLYINGCEALRPIDENSNQLVMYLAYRRALEKNGDNHLTFWENIIDLKS